MKKEGVSTYKGIDYVQLSSLPNEQVDALNHILTDRTLIKIQVNDVVLEDCVLYSTYESWYESQTKASRVEVTIQKQSMKDYKEVLPAA